MRKLLCKIDRMCCRQPIHAVPTGAFRPIGNRRLIGTKKFNQDGGDVLSNDTNTAERFRPNSFIGTAGVQQGDGSINT